MSSSVDLYQEIIDRDAEKKRATKKLNGVVRILEGMSETDSNALLDALYDESIDGKVILTVLVANGYQVSYDQVRRFRNGSCGIPEKYDRNGSSK